MRMIKYISWSWDEMLIWKDPNCKIYFVSYERFDGKIPQSAAPTRDIIWRLWQRSCSWYEPWIGSAQVDLP